jgi:hypothetical protein
MKHFSLEEWADFARNVVRQDLKKAMETHLERGCKKCAKAFELWRRVTDVAQRQTAQEPSEATVRTVKGMYLLHGSRPPRSKKATLAELLFDSFRTPLAAGVRSATASHRQLLFGAGDYRVDVRIEPQEDSDRVSLVGQVLNASDPNERLASAPVVLSRGGKVVARCLTSQFGEFHLQCGLESKYQLRVELPGKTGLAIPLVEAAGEMPRKRGKGTRRKV